MIIGAQPKGLLYLYISFCRLGWYLGDINCQSANRLPSVIEVRTSKCCQTCVELSAECRSRAEIQVIGRRTVQPPCCRTRDEGVTQSLSRGGVRRVLHQAVAWEVDNLCYCSVDFVRRWTSRAPASLFGVGGMSKCVCVEQYFLTSGGVLRLLYLVI